MKYKDSFDEFEYVHARRELEEVLHHPVLEETWHYLKKHYFIDQYLQGEKKLHILARDYKEIIEAGGKGKGKREPPIRTILSSNRNKKESSIDRTKALSILIVIEAENDEGVKAFRTNELGGRLLSSDQVEEWIFEKAEIDGSPTWWLANVPIPRENIVYNRIARSTERGLIESKVEVKIPTTPSSEIIHFHFLQYSIPNSADMREIPTTLGGVLQRLRSLSIRLSKEYGWTEGESTLFVLTDEAPEINIMAYEYQLNKRFPSLSRIVLTIDPTLSPREVADKYSPIRQMLLKGRHREQEEKHLQLAIFVATHLELKTWSERMAEWNRIQPNWKYKDKGIFARDCRDARFRLLETELEIDQDITVQKMDWFV